MLEGLAAISRQDPKIQDRGIASVAEVYAAKLELYRHPWFNQTWRRVAECSTKHSSVSETSNEPIRLTVTLFHSFNLRAGERSVEGDSWGFQIFHPIPIVQIQQGSVVKNPDYIEDVDVHSYQKLLSVSNQLWPHNRVAAVELLQKAGTLYPVQLLPQLLYLDWLKQFREQLQHQHGKALQRLARYYAERDEQERYEENIMELIELHPLDEELHADFIQYLLGSIRQSEAQQWYKRLERLLEEELGVRPSTEVTNLVKRHLGAYRKFGGNV